MKKDESEKIRNINPFGLRLQPELKKRVEAAAEVNGRSLNAEITAALVAAYPPVSNFDQALISVRNILQTLDGDEDPDYKSGLQTVEKELLKRIDRYSRGSHEK